MAEGAVQFVLTKLNELLTEEFVLLEGIRSDVKTLKLELESIQGFLRDADARQERDDIVKSWVKQVREVAYEIEDVLDEFLLQVAEQYQGHHRFTGSLHRAAQVVRHLKPRHSIATKIKDIQASVCDVRERSKRYNFISSFQGSSSSSNANDTCEYPRVASLFIEDDDIVGLEGPRDKLIGWMIEGSPKLSVIYVVGMGGLGKTTLVKRAYQRVKRRFDCHAWVTISQTYKKEDLLLDMFKQFCQSSEDPFPQGVDATDAVQIMDKLKDYLQQKRYVVVFDDIWNLDILGYIKLSLPRGDCGSRMVVTTRSDNVTSSHIDSPIHVYKLQPLLPNEAWDLFRKKAFSFGICPSELEQWSKRIVKRCEGLPLAIVAISSLLASKPKSVLEWKKFHDSLGYELECSPHLSSVKTILSLSYNDLPYNLKNCFLYFSIFPEDYSVKCTRLIRLWVAEGLVQGTRGKSLEEVAEDYLNDLIKKNMIHVSERDFDGRARSCRVHDLVREIIVSKSEKENFFKILTEPNSILDEKVRHVSMHIESCIKVSQNKDTLRARTLFVFGIDKFPNSSCQEVLPSCRFLKVLDLEDAPLKSFPKEVFNLLLLRYLSLRNTKVKKLSKSIGKLQNLETLDLKQTCVTKLPDQILQLQKLRHLLVYHYNFQNYGTFGCVQGMKVSAQIGGMIALQKLAFIKANEHAQIVKEIGKLTQLRKLGIIELKTEYGRDLCHSIEKMQNLHSLDVTSVRMEEPLDLHAISTPPRLLQRLYLKGKLEKLPSWISSLHDLVRIRLKWSRLGQNPIEALQDLPNLIELQLLDAYTGNLLDFYQGKFQKLKILEFEQLDQLSKAVLHKGTLPSLHKLIIRHCTKLNTLPVGIHGLTHLKELLLVGMPENFTIQLQKNGGNYRWMVDHIPSIHSYSFQSNGCWSHANLS